MGLNKNFAEVRLRYVTSLLLGFVGVLLMITTFSKDFIPMDIFTQDGVRAAYNYGLEQLGGGAVGSSFNPLFNECYWCFWCVHCLFYLSSCW